MNDLIVTVVVSMFVLSMLPAVVVPLFRPESRRQVVANPAGPRPIHRRGSSRHEVDDTPIAA